MLSTSRVSTRDMLLIVMVMVCLLIVGAQAARGQRHAEATARSTHGMMIDAGSDGSRIHVFSWDAVSKVIFLPSLLLYCHDCTGIVQ